MDGNLRSREREIEGGRGKDKALQISETSGVTGDEDNSRGSAEAEENARSSFQTSEWTNEKHSLYLSSIEASFVKQLHNREYNMMDLRLWLLRRQNVLQKYTKSSNANDHFSSGQFKVLKRGCWDKINFRRSQTQLDIRNDSCLLANPWILHFRQSSAGKGLLDLQSPNPLEDNLLACELIHSHRRKYRAPNCEPETTSSEVSDQNFVDEDCQKEGPLSSSCKKKRAIVSGADLSIKDQVVPFENCSMPDGSSEDGTSYGKRVGDCRSSQSAKAVVHPCPKSGPQISSNQ